MKKQTSLKLILNNVLPSFSILLKRKLSFTEKFKLATVVKDLQNKGEVYNQCLTDFLKQNCELDKEGNPKKIVVEKDSFEYVFKEGHNKATFLNYQRVLLEEKCEIPSYGITKDLLEKAFISSDVKEQEKLDEELGKILPTLIDFILD